MDICVLKLWCHPSSSRSKTYFWFVRWFILHSVLEKVPAAAPNGLSTAKNVISYQFSKFAVTVFQLSRESLRCGSQELSFFDRSPLDVLQMWRSTELSVSQNIPMDHVLIKNVCILLYAWAASPEMWNWWPTLKTALVQSLPAFAGLSFIICSSFLQYVGVCFGCDLLPIVTPAVIHLYVGKLPERTQEQHWITSSLCIPFSVKDIYFVNLGLWTLWSTWMTGPLFLWPLVAASRRFQDSNTELILYILLFHVFNVWTALCYFVLPLKSLNFSILCKLSEYFWRQCDASTALAMRRCLVKEVPVPFS